MNKNILNEIKLLLAARENPVAFLATVDSHGHPRVRPLTLMATPAGFYLATSRKSRKVAEIQHQSCVEWVTLFPTEQGIGYLRMAGRAAEVQGTEKRQAVDEAHYPVHKYWRGGVDDPDFVVFRIQPQHVEYIRPGQDSALDVSATFMD